MEAWLLEVHFRALPVTFCTFCTLKVIGELTDVTLEWVPSSGTHESAVNGEQGDDPEKEVLNVVICTGANAHGMVCDVIPISLIGL